MSTILEIQKPHLTYCEKYDIHCPCIKCNDPKHKTLCIKFICSNCSNKNENYYPTYDTNYCNNCNGPDKKGRITLKFRTLIKNKTYISEKVFTCCPVKVNKDPMCKEYKKL